MSVAQHCHQLEPRAVVKLGGSLLDLPDLPARLQQWLELFGPQRLIMVVGGGAVADLVRKHDRTSGLGAEAGHWLGVRAMAFNSYLVQALVPAARVIASLTDCQPAWRQGQVPILEPLRFLHSEQTLGGLSPLPASWAVTSDSIAARLARCTKAAQLVLLKSTDWPPERPVQEAARLGVVDQHLPHELAQNPTLPWQVVNLRVAKT